MRLSGIRKGRFGFPPESHRPIRTYAWGDTVQGVNVNWGNKKMADVVQRTLPEQIGPSS
jgi:hypothetical protein